MKSASLRGFSDQYDRGVPQKPQKWRIACCSVGDVHTRWICAVVSSGKKGSALLW
jgi:hypothetical protein